MLFFGKNKKLLKNIKKCDRVIEVLIIMISGIPFYIAGQFCNISIIDPKKFFLTQKNLRHHLRPHHHCIWILLISNSMITYIQGALLMGIFWTALKQQDSTIILSICVIAEVLVARLPYMI